MSSNALSANRIFWESYGEINRLKLEVHFPESRILNRFLNTGHQK